MQYQRKTDGVNHMSTFVVWIFCIGYCLRSGEKHCQENHENNSNPWHPPNSFFVLWLSQKHLSRLLTSNIRGGLNMTISFTLGFLNKYETCHAIQILVSNLVAWNTALLSMFCLWIDAKNEGCAAWSLRASICKEKCLDRNWPNLPSQQWCGLQPQMWDTWIRMGWIVVQQQTTWRVLTWQNLRA